MKPTALITTCLVVVAMALPLTRALAQNQYLGGPLAASANAQEARARCDDLCQRARQALTEKNYSGSEQLIAQAEALGVRYHRLFTGDTPAKLRVALQRARVTGGTGRTSLIPPFRRPTTVSPRDPFADFVGTTPPNPLAPAGGGLRPLPPVEESPAATPPSSDARRLSSQSILAARRALAVGDVVRATEFLQQAKSFNATYGASDDNPGRVEALLDSYNTLMAQRPTQGATMAFRRAHAQSLIAQADGLLKWRDFDRAQRLASQAADLNVAWTNYEKTPQTVLSQIAEERAQVRGAQTAGTTRGLRDPAPSTSLPTSQAARQQAGQLCQQGRIALGNGDLQQAEALAIRASSLRIPESAFRPNEDSPGRLLAAVTLARARGPAGLRTGGYPVNPATGSPYVDSRATRAIYNPQNDPTYNRTVQQQVPTPAAPPAAGASGAGMALFQQGLAALQAQNREAALAYFRQAQAYANELDPSTQQRLSEHLQMLRIPPGGLPAGGSITMIDEAATRQKILARQFLADVLHQQANARHMRATDPEGALAALEEMKRKVESAGLNSADHDQIIGRLDRALADTRAYIEQNQPRIAMDRDKEGTLAEIQREQEVMLDTQHKLSQMVARFNRLNEEGRYGQAEVLAKQARELDPHNPLTNQLVITSGLMRRHYSNVSLIEKKAGGFWGALDSVEHSGIAFDDRNPIEFPDNWRTLSLSRAELSRRQSQHHSEAELLIKSKLDTPVLLDFDNVPLSVVIETLASIVGINIIIDPLGIFEEAVSTEEPITIRLGNEISLRSALKHILEPRRLDFVIKDEVLKITSEDYCAGEVYPLVYSVADMVIPIPNFTPSSRMGLSRAYDNAMSAAGFGGIGSLGALGGSAPMAVIASRNGGSSSGMLNPNIMAQMGSPNMGGGGAPIMGGGIGGPGGMGGGAMADFDSLIDLIINTIDPTSWDEMGGNGSVQESYINLSLVIRQTEENHEEIVDLLGQLRKLQDLQVTIEVRFITLNDNFFERIGIDFDFDIDDDIDRPLQVWGRRIDDDDFDPSDGAEPPRNVLDVDFDRSVTVGMSAPGVFSADLDIPFTQNNFGLAVPQFGGFDASAGAQLGFAILSDIEAFFFINAAQGDRRSNVLQAPKVTLFNGQQAFVSDTSQSPFVISVVPVVGDFAVAQQPVIVILNEGTFLTVQAVISNDRRFVRLTVVPFFSRIGEVETFQFEGSTTTTSNTSQEGVQDDPNDNSSNSNSRTTTRSGTTVQLPTFSFVTVTTTVSVPDGGTVLLGGIKRLSEGRNEFGVPILNKLPYINRLFSNASVGRETQSLMMMVTPRIIIQEEEEQRLGIAIPD